MDYNLWGLAAHFLFAFGGAFFWRSPSFGGFNADGSRCNVWQETEDITDVGELMFGELCPQGGGDITIYKKVYKLLGGEVRRVFAHYKAQFLGAEL